MMSQFGEKITPESIYWIILTMSKLGEYYQRWVNLLSTF
jgi:hypothetical protein